MKNMRLNEKSMAILNNFYYSPPFCLPQKINKIHNFNIVDKSVLCCSSYFSAIGFANTKC